MICREPPEGWVCRRPAGHPGPCAAVEDPRAKVPPRTSARWLFLWLALSALAALAFIVWLVIRVRS